VHLASLLGVSLGVQVVGWAAAATLKTEKFYDLTGSATFLLLTGLSYSRSVGNIRQKVVTAMVAAWALRLGSFLTHRVIARGEDRRFDKVKEEPGAFLVWWGVQGVWVFVTLLPTLLLHTSPAAPTLGALDCLGWALWGVGFLLEVVADAQKSAFKSKEENQGKFISSGLWSISRHPNYLGEILLWSGLCLSAMSALSGAQHLVVLSPAMVALLITKVSGIPILERSGEERWGETEEYRRYLREVPVLLPFITKLDQLIYSSKAKD